MRYNPVRERQGIKEPEQPMQDQIIVAVFPSRRVLLSALDYILEEAASDIRRAAVIARSKTGEILVLDDTLDAEDGGVLGGLVGAAVMAVGLAGLGAWVLPAWNLLWVIALGLLLGAAVGWFVGQLAARYIRVPFALARDVVDKLSVTLQDGKPALVLHVKDAARLLPRLRDNLKQAELVEMLPALQN